MGRLLLKREHSSHWSLVIVIMQNFSKPTSAVPLSTMRKTASYQGIL